MVACERQAVSKFKLGQILITVGAREAINAACDEVVKLLRRHGAGDWGDISPSDAALNDQALTDGTRLLSAYLLRDSVTKVWVITEADRAATTVLMPDEY